jgi:hypothetical protein
MPVIDARGRLFGRLNFIDAIAGLLVLAMLGFLAVGYSLFRLPHDPRIDTFQPPFVTEMTPQRVQLNGENFLPYLRAFIKRTDGKDFVKRPAEDKPMDVFTLVNNTQVPFLLESPTLAELQVPPLPTGTYDIRFYNDTKLVLERPAALVVSPLEPPTGPQWEPTGSLIASGVFTNLRLGDDTAAIRVGTRVTAGGVAWGDVLKVEAPRPDVAPLLIDGLGVPTRVIGRVQVPATLRVLCVIDDRDCRVGGAQVAPTHVLLGAIGAQAVTFRVHSAEADPSGAAR